MAGQDWNAIDAYDVQSLEALFERDEGRLSAFSLELGGLYFDWSKTHLDAGLLERFVAIAESNDFAAARDPFRPSASTSKAGPRTDPPMPM